MSFIFENDVLALSHRIPVLVDFWAPWCGPCRVLGPVLEELENETNGKWKLVKINTEEYPNLATTYQIQSIPNVKLFYRGEVIDEFMGAMSKSAIENWLSEHLPDEDKQQLEELIDSINPSNATGNRLNSLIEFCVSHPDMEQALVMAGVFLSYQDPERAISLVSSIKMESKYFQTAEDISRVSKWIMNFEEGSENPIHRAAFLLKNFYFRDSIGVLVDSLIHADDTNKEVTRKLGIALFRLFGHYFDWGKSLRKKFDMYLS
ncbi:MAG: thioredoxin [Saprospiraceae bacterium]|jgi:putative thioredoxin